MGRSPTALFLSVSLCFSLFLSVSLCLLSFYHPSASFFKGGQAPALCGGHWLSGGGQKVSEESAPMLRGAYGERTDQWLH